MVIIAMSKKVACNMNKIKPALHVIIILLLFIVLHNAIITLLGNIFAIMRNDNRYELLTVSYEKKIDTLERAIANYEKSTNALKIYEGSNYIISRIAIRDIYDFYNFAILSTDSLVKKGNAVINEKGLVGLIESANKTTAKVNFLTGGVKVSVKIGDVYGMLGEYDTKEKTFVVHNINNYQPIEVDAKVVTSGLQELDGDLPIGKVVKTEVVGVEKKVYVKPYVDFDDLNYLMVINK